MTVWKKHQNPLPWTWLTVYESKRSSRDRSCWICWAKCPEKSWDAPGGNSIRQMASFVLDKSVHISWIDFGSPFDIGVDIVLFNGITISHCNKKNFLLSWGFVWWCMIHRPTSCFSHFGIHCPLLPPTEAPSLWPSALMGLSSSFFIWACCGFPKDCTDSPSSSFKAIWWEVGHEPAAIASNSTTAYAY